MEQRDAYRPVRGFIFACTEKSEMECLKGLLFGTEKTYGPIVIRIREGDLLFLDNIDTDTLHGVLEGVSGDHEILNARLLGERMGN
ncbi:MAG: hypothetical protein ISS53_02800 [Dehalococcoidia bacterium]|nr:hypothetical protein [Dehalococcoidia bacterium]